MSKDSRTKKNGLHLTGLDTSPRGIVRLIMKKAKPIEGYNILRESMYIGIFLIF